MLVQWRRGQVSVERPTMAQCSLQFACSLLGSEYSSSRFDESKTTTDIKDAGREDARRSGRCRRRADAVALLVTPEPFVACLRGRLGLRVFDRSIDCFDQWGWPRIASSTSTRSISALVSNGLRSRDTFEMDRS